MNGALPKGWVISRLENCTKILDNFRKPINSKERAIRIEGKNVLDLFPYYGATGKVGYIDDFLIEGRYVLIGEDGAPFLDSNKNIAYIVDGKIWVNNHAHLLDSLTDNVFLCHFLNQFNFTGYVTGTTRLKLTQSKLREIPILLPPLNEQKRIVAKLDKIIPRIDSVQARLDRVPTIIKRFRQSVLTAAVTGKLTGNTNEYPNVVFDNVIISIRGGTTVPPMKDKTAFPVLRSSSVRQGFINYEDVFYLTAEQSTKKANFIQNGDVLFTRLNGSAEFVGNCAVVNFEDKAIYQYPDRLYCAKLRDNILPDYCEIAFSAPTLRFEIENRAKSSAGHKRISISDIKEMVIPLPPLEEQQEIVRQVDKLFALADKLEAHYQKAKTHVGKLSQSVLAKAFRGELVPQDPNDEPAEKLLARIMKEKNEKSKRPAAKRTAP